MKAGFFETIGDGGDFPEGHCGPAVGRDNLNLLELVGPLASLLESQQNLAGIRFDGPGRNVFA